MRMKSLNCLGDYVDDGTRTERTGQRVGLRW